MRERLDRLDTATIGLAGAALAANALALLFTVVFARLLGTDGYGELATCVSAFLILAVAGSALQVAAARDVAAGRYGHGPDLAAVVHRWMRSVVIGGSIATAAALALHDPIGALLDIEARWAASLTVPAAAAWLGLCLLRGALQGEGRIGTVGWSIVGEAGGRIVFGLVLVLAGADVFGAFLGTPLTFLVTGLVLLRALGPGHAAPASGFGALVRTAWAPIAGLTLLMALQNVDVILAQHRLADDPAGSYAAAAIAAKVLVWVAVGLALQVVPEASRRATAGDSPFAPLRNALLVLGALAVPVALLYVAVPRLVLELAFGEAYGDAAPALLPLAVAMSLLACTYLGTQYLLALHHARFLAALGVAVAAEIVALAILGDGFVSLALVVLAVHAAVAAIVLVAARAAHAPAPGEPEPEHDAELALVA